MSSIAQRLESIRAEHNLSLREFANRIGDAGFTVSHSAVRDYEKGRTVPAGYILGVASAFEVDAGWILTGETLAADDNAVGQLWRVREDLDEVLDLLRQQLSAEEQESEVRRAWSRFIRDLDPEHSLRDVVLRSWERSRALGVDPERDRPSTRLDDQDLEKRRRERSTLVTFGAEHLSWVRKLYDGRTFFLALADENGTILLADGSDRELLAERGGLPGFQWTEDEMGTNSVGTALAEQQPVVLIGAEHYAEELHGLLCLGCPVSQDGEVVGVLAVGLPLNEARPPILATVCYAAEMISRDLNRPPA